MAIAARRPPAKSSKSPALATTGKTGIEPAAPAPDAPQTPKKPATADGSKSAKPKRIRDSFSMPESDYARLARLKATAKRAGLKVKKNELLRLGLRALQSLTGPELQDAVLSLRVPEPVRRKAK